MDILNFCPTVAFDIAIVILPAGIVISKSLAKDKSQVAVPPAEGERAFGAVTIAPSSNVLTDATVWLELKLTAVPEILVVSMAALAEILALLSDPFISFAITLKFPLNCAAVGTVPSAKVVVSVITAIY